MKDLSILETKYLTKQFGGLAAVEDLSINIRKAHITSVIGPNGAGKTTLFNLMTGFLRPTSGEIFFKSKNISGLPPYRITQMGMARTFQLIRVFPKLSVLDNIMLGCIGLKGDNLFWAILRTKEVVNEFSQSKELAMQILETIGLPEYTNQYANNLSYGQQKLVEIGRVLASDPQIILLDEPMAGLSMIMIDRMIELVSELKQQGKTVVLVEHNMGVVMDISDEIIVLNFGREITSGSPTQIQNNVEVFDAYLGV